MSVSDVGVPFDSLLAAVPLFMMRMTESSVITWTNRNLSPLFGRAASPNMRLDQLVSPEDNALLHTDVRLCISSGRPISTQNYTCVYSLHGTCVHVDGAEFRPIFLFCLCVCVW